MSADTFFRMVRTSAGIDDALARRATATVFRALRDRLTPEESDQVVAQLPLPLKDLWCEGEVEDRRPAKWHSPEFFERVRAGAGLSTMTEARRLTLAVFAALKVQLSPGESEDVRAQLPDDLKEVWTEAMLTR